MSHKIQEEPSQRSTCQARLYDVTQWNWESAFDNIYRTNFEPSRVSATHLESKRAGWFKLQDFMIDDSNITGRFGLMGHEVNSSCSTTQSRLITL